MGAMIGHRHLTVVAAAAAVLFGAAGAHAAMNGPLTLEMGGAAPVSAAEDWQVPLPGVENSAVSLRVSLRPDLDAGATAAAPSGFDLAPATGLSMGGFLTWYVDDFALTGTAAERGADLSATYRPESLFNGATSFRLSLGADWGRPDGGTPLRLGLDPAGAVPAEPGGGADYSLSFSVRHNIFSNLYVGGVATAENTTPRDGTLREERHFLFGAGLGLRF